MTEETVVVDDGQVYVSEETAIIATEAAEQAKQWAEESERQANIATTNADTAVAAKDDAIAAKEYAEAAITDPNLITVATDLSSTPSNIKTVATNINNVNAVGGNINNVNNVAGNATNINAVNANKTNINTVANNKNYVIAVGLSISNVNKVGNKIDDVSSVAGDLTNVDIVADDIENVKAVGENINNVNAVESNISNINTVAGDHANIQTVINNMTAINNAPTYANNSKKWAEGLDGEVTPLGGTHSSKGWAEIAEQAASGVQNPANRDLSNLTADGQTIIDSQNGTTSNCILGIPQNIKASISNGVLTVATGSKVYIPNGSGIYNEFTFTADKTASSTGISNGINVICCKPSYSTLFARNIANCVSGAGATTTGGFAYDTTTNTVGFYNNSGELTATDISFPLCLVNVEGGVITDFAKDSNGNDMIFNGVGFIGNAIFVYPNIEALNSDGYSENDSLKSIKIKNNSLIIKNWTDGLSTTDAYLFADSNFAVNRCFINNYYEQEETPTPASNLSFWRNNEQNTTQKANSGVWEGRWIMLAKYTRENNKIVSMTMRKPYEGARNLLTDNKQANLTTLTGYDATQTQTLKNINGVLTWVTDGE